MTKKVNLVPVGRKIIIKPIDPTTETDFGIVIPASARDSERPTRGLIVAIGSLVGINKETGKEEKTPLVVGKNVLFSKYSPSEIEYEGEKYLIVNETDILAVIQE